VRLRKRAFSTRSRSPAAGFPRRRRECTTGVARGTVGDVGRALQPVQRRAESPPYIRSRIK
jgi:hypothetical protein